MISDCLHACLQLSNILMFLFEKDLIYKGSHWNIKGEKFFELYLKFEELINELKKLGNAKAIIITTTNRGYRKPNNVRHPHSWSIVNPPEIIKWLESQ